MFYFTSVRVVTKSINFYVMIPYAYKAGINTILTNTKGVNVSLYIGEIIEPIKINTTEEILKWLDNISVVVYEDGTTRCLYFQHKVAINMSTLYSVYVEGKIDKTDKYGTILNNIPDRAQIKNLEDFLSIKSGGYKTRKYRRKRKLTKRKSSKI